MPFKRRSAGFRAVTRWITLFLATSITLGAGIAAASPASSNRATTFQNGEQQVLKSAVGVIRVMIVGDSITQGREGDWTWRYRLWQWFDDQGIDVNFVGPWTGTMPPEPAHPPVPPPFQDAPPSRDNPGPVMNGGYAIGVDPNFDSVHFSAWGRQLAQDKVLIHGMVEKYRPDYLLVLLGFNDIGWFVSDAKGTFDSMKTFIAEARAAKPDVKFALGNIPHRTLLGGREDLPINTDAYNKMLEEAIPVWTTRTSQIELVRMQENYCCDIDSCPAAYDGLHPNVLGEFQIAQAFSRTLVDSFGIGTGELLIPRDLPARPISVPINFKAVSSPLGITVTWDAVYGVFGYELQSRFAGLDAWTDLQTAFNRYDTSWVLDGWEYEFRIRSNNGEDSKSPWSRIVSAVCHPETPPAPTHIVTMPTARGVDISWTRRDFNITEYVVLVYTPGQYMQWIGIKPASSSAHIGSLIPGRHYSIAMQSWNKYGGGFPRSANSVIIGAGTPPQPTNFQITSLDRTTVELAWCGSPDAAGYRVWFRNINDGGNLIGESITTETRYGVSYLIPGVWDYEFCVSAINGNLESRLSECLVGPQPGEVAGGPVGGTDCYSGNRILDSG